MNNFCFLLIVVLTLSPLSILAKNGIDLSVGFGNAFSYDESVTIKRDNLPDINMPSVAFKTKPFEAPWYYNVRVSSWEKNKAYELEFIHHKLYATSGLGKGVDELKITDGYNIIYINHAINWKNIMIARLGVGPIIANPDITVDGIRSHGNYQFAGASVQLGLEKEFSLGSDWGISIESKVTYSYASIDIDRGSLIIPNTAFHIIMGMKYYL